MYAALTNSNALHSLSFYSFTRSFFTFSLLKRSGIKQNLSPFLSFSHKKLFDSFYSLYFSTVASIKPCVTTTHLPPLSACYQTPIKEEKIFNELSVARLVKERKKGVRTEIPPLADLRFGQFFTDHLLEVDWNVKNGWDTPRIVPFRNLSLHPGSSALHYGLEVFEGLKCFRDSEGSLLLFRPLLNMRRLLRSSKRMALPSFDEMELLKLMIELIKMDEEFVPQKDGYSLYIRPVIFSTQPSLGVSFPEHAKLCITLSCCGPYFPHGYKPVKVLANAQFSRAGPGGVGDCKVGGNYGPTIYPNNLAAENGYNQMIWLYAQDDDFQITECGAMNFFIYWINEQGEKELATPALGNNLILPGVMRDSILHLAKSYGKFKVTERPIYMKRDFIKAYKEGRVIEVFGSGTAVVVCSVDLIGFEDVKYELPVDKDIGAGKLAYKLLNDIFDIQYGRKKMYDEQGQSWALKI